MSVLRLLAALLLPAALLGGPAFAASPAKRTGAAKKWACFYGANISAQSWKQLDLVIVDPDSFQLPAASTGPVRLAYVSAGEADERRSFWPVAAGKDYLVEANPDWAGAHRVDIRSAEWRELLISSVVPQALEKGYSGVMLDTLDTAEYFEYSGPVKFKGSMAAARKFVLDLRARNPGAVILINNGLPLLSAVGGAIDGLVIEDLYTRCDKNDCKVTPRAEAASREAAAAAFAKRYKKPVFAIIYARPQDRRSQWVRDAVKRARASGFRPYLAGATLERLGTVEPGGP